VEQALSDSEYQLLVRLEAILEAVLTDDGEYVRSLLPYELKRRGEFGSVNQAVAAEKRLLREMNAASLSLEDVNVTLPKLLEWYQENYVSIDGSLGYHSMALGFASLREFLQEVVLEYAMRDG
jgi:hypothetical protein